MAWKQRGSGRSRRFRPAGALAVALAFAVGCGSESAADQIYLKNGGVLQGFVDRDNTLVSVSDELKRTIIRYSKIEHTDPDPPSERQDLESFKVLQPLEVHGGKMPSNVLQVRAEPWDEVGQRMFEYKTLTASGRLKTVRMKQAINEIGPKTVHYRGIDGFWVGKIATDQVPRKVLLGVLEAVDRTDKNERLRVARFMIQARWYEEALRELETLERDFEDLAPVIRNVRTQVRDLQATARMDEAETRLQAGQPRRAEAILRSIDPEPLSAATRGDREALLERVQARSRQANSLADALERAWDELAETRRSGHRDIVYEVLQGISEVPDVALERLTAFEEAVAPSESPPLEPAARVALAISSWIAGADHATDDLDQAGRLTQARALMLDYLKETDGSQRERLIPELDAALAAPDASAPEREADDEAMAADFDTDVVEAIIKRLPPWRTETPNARTEVPLIRRVLDDPNPTPTEYIVVLPPEYHPKRSYPAVVLLHDGRGPRRAIEPWAEQAALNGYVIIAPEYMRPDEDPDYRYSPDEHVATLLAVRDVRKRFAIDPNRVFLAGSLIGGNAAWDIGLAHPDVFAGVVTISGLPAKYVPALRNHAEYLPFLVVIGDLATAATEALVFEFVKPMITKTWDVTYTEYERRGLETLPESIPDAFDWMNRRERTPHRDEFEVAAARETDSRFYGIVIRGFTPGRTTAPSAVDPLGRDLKPATLECKRNQMANLISLSVSGINAADVWVSADLAVPKTRLEIRVNGRQLFRDDVRPDLEAALEDVRVRADRGQIYWAKIPLGGRSSR